MPDEPLDYQTNSAAQPIRVSRKRRALEICAVIGIIGLLISIVIPILKREREETGQIPCASNLRQIGQAIFLYCYDVDSHYPPDLAALLRTQGLSPKALICPASDDTPASSPADLSQPGHCSYIYIGSNLTWSKNLAGVADTIIAFEDPALHDLEGASVLYADGHVIWVFLPDLMTAINDLAAGRNPSTSKSTFTIAAAKQEYKRNWQSRMSQFKSTGWHIPTTQLTTQPPERK